MKGLKEFIEAVAKDEALRAEVEKVQDDAAKVVEIAKKHGYSFTDDEYNDEKMAAVSGGGLFNYAMTGLQAKLMDRRTPGLADFYRITTGHQPKNKDSIKNLFRGGK